MSLQFFSFKCFVMVVIFKIIQNGYLISYLVIRIIFLKQGLRNCLSFKPTGLAPVEVRTLALHRSSHKMRKTLMDLPFAAASLSWKLNLLIIKSANAQLMDCNDFGGICVVRKINNTLFEGFWTLTMFLETPFKKNTKEKYTMVKNKNT